MKSLYSALFLITLFFISSSAFSQKLYNMWYFGAKAGLDFNSGIPKPLTDGAMSTTEGCSTISDSNGKLLFYTNGEKIWSKDHAEMATGLKGCWSSFQSALIVPKPGSNSIYYVFTVDCGEHNFQAGLHYTEVDMSLNGGLGEVTDLNVQLGGNGPRRGPKTQGVLTTEALVGIRHRNCEDFWVVVKDLKKPLYYSFKITSAGVDTVAVQSSINIDYNYFGAMLIASPNGKKIFHTLLRGGNLAQVDTGRVLMDFNNSSGVISNPIRIVGKADVNTYGASFSPDNSKLYMGVADSIGPYVFPFLYQYDVSSNDLAQIEASRTLIDTVWTGAMQLGPDCKIYITSLGSAPYLHIINRPNEKGIACNYVDSAVRLGGKEARFGLPNIINGLLSQCVLTACNNICNLLSARTKPISEDCCHELTLFNNYAANVIYGITAEMLTPGVTVGSASGPASWTTSTPTPTSVTWNVPTSGLPMGVRDSLFICFSKPQGTLLSMKINWLNAAGVPICTDTIVYGCGIPSDSVSKISGDRNGMGTAFLLGNAYPNPSRGKVTIPYSLSGNEKSASLSLTNILGQVIATNVLNGERGNYTHELTLPLGSTGLYFYTLRTQMESRTKSLFIVH